MKTSFLWRKFPCISKTTQNCGCEDEWCCKLSSEEEFGLRTLYSSSKKKRNTPIYFNTNYRAEMKLVPIIMDYCLL